MPNHLTVQGVVTIRQSNRVLVEQAVNHFVDAGLKGLLSSLMWQFIYRGSGGVTTWYLPASLWHIYCGNDVSTATTTGTTALVDPIGTPPGTAPDVLGGSVHSGAGDGDWYLVFTGTWNAGTLPAETLGEVALYMRIPAETTFLWAKTSDYTPTEVLISRLSEADGDFGSFTIDTSKPLTVDWKIQFQFT